MWLLFSPSPANNIHHDNTSKQELRSGWLVALVKQVPRRTPVSGGKLF